MNHYVLESGETETVKTVKWNFGAVYCTNYYDLLQDLVDDNEWKLKMEVYTAIIEFANIGASIGRGFNNTSELKVMKYKEAINRQDGEAWKAEIDNEHDQMVQNKAWEVIE